MSDLHLVIRKEDVTTTLRSYFESEAELVVAVIPAADSESAIDELNTIDAEASLYSYESFDKEHGEKTEGIKLPTKAIENMQ